MNRFLIISLLLILTSCVAKKQAAEFEAQPTWMKKKPIESGYYIGVGSAKKVGPFKEYTKNAKRDALTDLAEEISLNISATSVLHTIETETGFDESYNRTILISTEDYLEGFEPVDYYENENSYWVYYRISKATYVEKKALKKHQAIEAAKEKYLAGKKEEELHHVKNAISFYLQGLQAIYNYLGEETINEVNGKSIDMGNELYASLNKVVSDLKIEAIKKQVSVKDGDMLESPIVFKIFSKSKNVNGLPVNFNYTGGYLKKDHGYTNEYGLVEINPGVIRSHRSIETITAEINLNEIGQKAVDNLFIRGILTKQIIEPADVIVNITKRNVMLSLPDHYCNNDPCEKIRNVFDEIALSEGYNLSTQNDIAFTFTVKFTTKKGERAGGLVATYLTGELSLLDENYNQIWAKSIKDIKGIGNSSNDSRKNAFDEFVADLNRIYFPEAFDRIN